MGQPCWQHQHEAGHMYAGDIDVSQGIDLGSKKRAEVTIFKGKKLVNLREFYEKVRLI